MVVWVSMCQFAWVHYTLAMGAELGRSSDMIDGGLSPGDINVNAGLSEDKFYISRSSICIITCTIIKHLTFYTYHLLY